MGDIFTDLFQSTLGVDIRVRTLKVDDKMVKLKIHDTTGQERFKAITNTYYKDKDGIVIVYDITKQVSFQNVNTWLENVNHYSMPNSYKVLVGNKLDLEQRDVILADAKSFANDQKLQLFETSAKTSQNVEKLFVTMASQLLEIENRKRENTLRDDSSCFRTIKKKFFGCACLQQ